MLLVKKDQLSQWRAYGSMGCCIAFESSELLNLFGTKIYNNNERVVQKIVRVLYNEKEKTELSINLINSIIETSLDILNKIREKNNNTLNLSELVRLILGVIPQETFWIFDLLISSCKHNSFSEEDEIRLPYLDYGNYYLNSPKVSEEYIDNFYKFIEPKTSRK